MRRSEIWLVDFSPSVGNEIHKLRPAVIVNHETLGALDLKIVVPITGSNKHPRMWHIPVKPNATNRLTKESFVDCFQIKCFDNQRFHKKIGVLEESTMSEVRIRLAQILDLL